MLGTLIFLVVLLVVIPVSVMMTGAILSGLLGWALKDNGEQIHEGSELIELS